MSDGGRSSAKETGFAFRIRAPREFWGGLALVAIAAIALFEARDLAGMDGFLFGPGTTPRLYAVLLGLAGAAIAVTGLLKDGPAIGSYALRGPALVVIAILGFAVMIRPLGLVVTTFLTFTIAIAGSREMRLVESLIAAAAMTAFCVLVFSYLLQLPFQLWPAFLT